MLRKWNSFIKESTSFNELLSSVKLAFIELLEENIVTIYIENTNLEYVVLQTSFINESKGVNANNFFKSYDNINEHIKDIQTAISRLESDNIDCVINMQNIGFNFEMKFVSKDVETGSFYKKRGNLVSIEETNLKASLLVKKDKFNSLGFDLHKTTTSTLLKIHFSYKEEINRRAFPYISNDGGLSFIFKSLEIGDEPFIMKVNKFSNENYPYYILVELNPKFNYELID